MQNESDGYLKEIEMDFSRNIWCLLGLCFDKVDMKEAVDLVVLAALDKRSFFVSTPNLNFLCAAQNDQSFRQSVINSHLSVADGMPIVLIARLLNIPITERVAGSDLINALDERKTDSPLKIYFFGGDSGVAEKASIEVNKSNSGLSSVGFYTPGFGSVEEMSADSIITEINSHDIDFIIVSLGAKKGQTWIEKNRSRLNAPVISHLGAVVNFFANTVQRAPKWVQRSGLEWCWRIYQEPSLWKRYFADGIQLIKMFFFNVFPYWFWLKKNQNTLAESPVDIQIKPINDDKQFIIVELKGNCIKNNNAPLRKVFKEIVLKNKDVTLDLSFVKQIDGSFIGLCLLLEKYLSRSGKKVQLVNLNPILRKILKWNRVEYLAEKR